MVLLLLQGKEKKMILGTLWGVGQYVLLGLNAFFHYQLFVFMIPLLKKKAKTTMLPESLFGKYDWDPSGFSSFTSFVSSKKNMIALCTEKKYKYL